MVILGRKKVYNPEEEERKESVGENFRKLYNLLSERVGYSEDTAERVKQLGEIEKISKRIYKSNPEALERGVESLYESKLIAFDSMGYDIHSAISRAVPETDEKTRKDLAEIRSERAKKRLEHSVASAILSVFGLILIIKIIGLSITSSSIRELESASISLSIVGAVVIIAALWILYNNINRKS